ncbi:epimerase [Dyadobacter luteus]|uniref:Epimerase n=1 Tax=Dyadobacter luteus TaxID=2259619 RepID=A0A3D8Y676_9BACT|nr:epimerase [Dyadobacter luteus]REA58197.1 epimerase [Dyadobacter luteus]
MKVIITGTTGMIGEGVLLECLSNPKISEVLGVSRKPSGIIHPKLSEYIVPDFLSLPENDPKLAGYDACFFCAGVSSVGMSAEKYKRLTYDTTIQFSRAIHPNPKQSFVYVSGGGTDSSEKGMSNWARVKGKTENDLMKMPFKQVFGFRIGFVKPADGQKRVLSYYKYLSWLFPFITAVFPRFISSMRQVAGAMIEASENGYTKNVIQVEDITILSKRNLVN